MRDKRRRQIARKILTQYLVPWFFIASIFSGCSGVYSPVNHQEFSSAAEESATQKLMVLSGLWEYQEGTVVYELMLDDCGNGSYDWHEGYFRTISFSPHRWLGIWHQLGNDREGEFEARLADDGQSAEGRWWYTRIGSDRDPPLPGGHFLLVRKGS